MKRNKQEEMAAKKQKTVPKRSNTSVYVSQLPSDTSISELEQLFSKYGVLLEDPETGDPKIKMYKDEQGAFTGNALVIYLKEESVQLAIELLDDSDFRPGKASKIKVEKAVFKEKPSKETTKPNSSNKLQHLRKKLDWDDDQDKKTTLNKHARVVVLKNMFTLQELDEDPALLLDLKEDVRQECERFGPVTNVVLYDHLEEGVMTVKFEIQESAVRCVQKMNGRYFGGKTVQAYIHDGREKFKRRPELTELLSTTDDHERLDKYAEWLESQE